MGKLLVFDSSFLIRFKDQLWNRRAFHPIQEALGQILSGGFGYIIHEVVGEIKAPEFVKWLKDKTVKSYFDVKINESIQDLLNKEVIPAYRRHQVGSVEKHIRESEYAADPVLIAHALYMKNFQLLPVFVVADDSGIEKVCSHLEVEYAGWDEFFDKFMYESMRKKCPECYP